MDEILFRKQKQKGAGDLTGTLFDPGPTAPTSAEAHARVEPTLTKLRALVLQVIEAAGPDGVTREEIARTAALKENTVNGRVAELIGRKLVRVRPGVRRDGRAVIVAVAYAG